MVKMYAWCKREFLHVLPVFLFFLAGFNLLNLTEGFLLQEHGGSMFSFWEVVVAAGVIAKIVLVLDHLSFIHPFPRYPLIWNILWKTVFYEAVTLCVRLSIRLFPYLLGHDGLENDVHLFAQGFDWKFFLVIHTWYLVLFFVFVSARDLALSLGHEKVRKLFFGK